MKDGFVLLPHYLRKLIQRALEEDVGPGDATTAAVLRVGQTGRAVALSKAGIVVAGIDVFREVFLAVDPEIVVTVCRDNGEEAGNGDILAEISGRLASILMAERVALNFLQRMCGIATATSKYVAEVKGTKARILDTRKTAPGLRLLDKLAVRTGGGGNHRFGLYHGILVKDNHIAAAGGIASAVALIREGVSHMLKVEVEVNSIEGVEEALRAGADIVMLDNMSVSEMKKAVSLVGGRIPLEASGNITLTTVREVAETGVDFISVGALTHSVIAADISLKVE